jgi:hypothetical protein
VLLPIWARVVAAALLLGGGIWIGAEVQGSGAQAAGDSPRATSSHSATAGPTGSSSTGSSTTRGPNPGPVATPPPCVTHQAGTTPTLCLSQPYGDGDTGYVIHGTGFQKFTKVTVLLVGVGVAPYQPVTSPDQPTTDMQGAFNYIVDQGHRFFAGPIPPGIYKVEASESGGHSASASFQVNPAAENGPPGVPPGQGPP